MIVNVEANLSQKKKLFSGGNGKFVVVMANHAEPGQLGW